MKRTIYIAGPKGEPPSGAGVYEGRLDAKWVQWLPHEVKDRQSNAVKGTVWTPHIIYDGLLELAAKEKPIHKLKTEIVQAPNNHNGHVCIISATVIFKDGDEYTDIADADKNNVGGGIKDSFIRMSSTRAKARVLRDGLKIEGAVAEEISGRSEQEQAATPAPPVEDDETKLKEAKYQEIRKLTFDEHGASDETLVLAVKTGVKMFGKEQAMDCSLDQLEDIAEMLITLKEGGDGNLAEKAAAATPAPAPAPARAPDPSKPMTPGQQRTIAALHKRDKKAQPDYSLLDFDSAAAMIKAMRPGQKQEAKPTEQPAAAAAAEPEKPTYDEGEQVFRKDMQTELGRVFLYAPEYEDEVRIKMREQFKVDSYRSDAIPTHALEAWVALAPEPVEDGEPLESEEEVPTTP